MVESTRARVSMGCLTVMIIFGVAGYVGMQVGEPYYRFYQFKDAVQQEVRFCDHAYRRRESKKICMRRPILSDSRKMPTRQGDSDADTSAHPASYTDSWSIGPYTRPVIYESTYRIVCDRS